MQNVFLGTYGVHCLFSFLMQNSCLRQLEFELVEIFLIDVITDCFPGHACCAVSVLFCDDKDLAGVTKLNF